MQFKTALTTTPALAYYNVQKPVLIRADTESGLGSCSLQHHKPVAYAFRSMTPAECTHAQIEKKVLAFVFATKKVHRYIYGKESVLVQTDGKPFESIAKNPFSKDFPDYKK